MTSPSSLFPEIQSRHQGFLEPDSVHRIYWEESGNPSGIPVLFLHGGPGSGSSPLQRRFFDPAFYRIVLFDQRGSGKSTPYASIADNTTQHLIADIELLRTTLGIERWLVFGGSWGSTLALAYGEAHPEACLGFVLRGIFLCRKSEIDWFLYGMRVLFPEAWRTFSALIPENERLDLLAAYHARLINPDPAIHMPAARAWAHYEAACSTLLPNESLISSFESDAIALSLARIEAHYFVNGIFLPENSLLDNLNRIRHLPAVIVHGRYDAVCPIVTADELARAWPEAFYEVVPDAGHSAFEPGIAQALVDATEAFKDMLGSPAPPGRKRKPSASGKPRKKAVVT
ncbi:MAG: prolyl aminopeptidase [Hydrogenophilaceae bacterium]|nr:prolyl aminopeptidase [Hydrogenophilaceae bacterium]